MADKKIVITKIGDSGPKQEIKSQSKPEVKVEVKAGKKPLKSILKKTAKIRGVRDPSKSPPLKPGMVKHTLKMFTDKGSKKHSRTLKNKFKTLKKKDLQKYMENPDLKLNPKTPTSLAKKIITNAISAGFISEN
jgi:hypothetical protein